MSYVLPTFVLKANVWINYSVALNYNAPSSIPICNLTPGKRVMNVDPTLGNPALYKVAPVLMELLLPKLTDIRPWIGGGNQCLCEVPNGSNRFYNVVGVDDIGKGFANEHRIAWLQMIYGSTTFADVGVLAFPFPLP